jgi:hypothetical protein
MIRKPTQAPEDELQIIFKLHHQSSINHDAIIIFKLHHQSSINHDAIVF